MKEFSQELVTDRKFEIGGVVLEWRYPYFEEIGALVDQAQQETKNGEGDIGTIGGLELTISRIGLFLTDDSAERWKDRVHQKEDPIPAFQIGGLWQWLIEVTSGRPTLPPLASPAGGGTTGASSPDGSPSTEETPTA